MTQQNRAQGQRIFAAGDSCSAAVPNDGVEFPTQPRLDGSVSGYALALLNIRRDRSHSEVIAEALNALAVSSGWRWAAVARVVPHTEHAQLVAFSERGQTKCGHTYALAGTPCAVVAQRDGALLFADMRKSFPDEHEAQEMGIRSYLGLCYRSNGTVIGHVILMHDGTDGACSVEDAHALLSLACVFLGSLVELLVMESVLANTRIASETDALTGLPNRRAFDREVALQEELIRAGNREDSMLLLLDVDGLKTVNDEQGHGAGDVLLKLVGRTIRETLREGQDQVFRLGGDEFAVVVDAPGSEAVELFEMRIADWNAAISRGGFPQAGISHGIARRFEAGPEHGDWFDLADKRMYKVKRVRKSVQALVGAKPGLGDRDEAREAARRIQRVA